MKRYLIGALVFLSLACDDPVTWNGHAASLQVVLDSSLTPGWLAVKVGDSLIVAQPGERSRCVVFDRLSATRVTMWSHTPLGDGSWSYAWPVQPPYVDLWVDLQQVADSFAMYHIAWVNRACGDTVLVIH